MGRSTQGQKGNPAGKRMGNLKRKDRREASWLRGERRHRIQAEKNAALHGEAVANLGLGRRERRRIEAGIRTQVPRAE